MIATDDTFLFFLAVFRPCLTFVFLHDSQGDATYLMVTEDNEIQDYGLVAICTHLGCIVPWNAAENKFICPCHNSHYDPTGKARVGKSLVAFAQVSF